MNRVEQGAGSRGLFSGRMVALLLAVGIAGFVAMLVLTAYAPDLRAGRNGGAHALSDGATGYSGLVALAEATGRKPRVLRDPRLFTTPDLLIATPERGAVNISAALIGRDYKPTLFVLPKWRTARDEDRPGWVRHSGLLPLSEPIGVLAPGTRFTMRRVAGKARVLTRTGAMPPVTLRAPPRLQVITGVTFAAADTEDMDDEEEAPPPPRLIPLVTDGQGGIVLARLGDAPRYVLSDPDLINNLGMKNLAAAAGALAMLDALDPRDTRGLAFDVTFNGLGRNRNILKLAFEPPFVAMTLTLAAALVLVGLAALARFGPIAPRARAIAYGKAVLVDNSAALVRKAGREGRMGGRYAAVMRDHAARIFGAPARLHDGALTDYLDTLGRGARFSELAQAAEAADDRRSLLAAARALHAWQADTLGRRS